MGDLLYYTDKSKTIDARISAVINQIKTDYNNGKIKTETEYFYRLKNAVLDIYKSLNQPLYKYVPAKWLPNSSDYNQMVQQAVQDMTFLINDCVNLSEYITQSFTDADISRIMMQNEIAYLSKAVDGIAESVAMNEPNGTVVFTEIFSDTDKISNMSTNNSCTVNTQDGTLTLRQTTTKLALIQQTQIDNEFSNGFPGNTHAVDTLNSNLHFIGRDGLHNIVSDVTKNTKDTWFEFELFHITDKTRRECNSFGFEYQEGVSWIVDEDQILRLKLTLTLRENTNCTWITLKPYLTSVKGIKSAILKECSIIASNGTTYVVAVNKSFHKTLVLPFPAQQVNKIELILEQPSTYPVKIAHDYYNKVDTESMSIFQDTLKADQHTRLDGDKPSINLLGVKYNPKTQWIDYNSPETASDIYIKDKLFSEPKSTIQLKAGRESLDAYRYMIGIMNIKAVSCTFMKYSESVSVRYTTKKPITSIVLESEEYIPGDDPEILRYFVSLDGGINWHKIYPTHRAYTGIYKYTVNNDSIENLLTTDTTTKRSRNLTTLGDCYGIQLKIEMNRPVKVENEEASSPIVQSYKIKLTTGGETIEY